MRPFTIFLACLALYVGILSILAMLASASVLEISANATGQGAHVLDIIGMNATGGNLSWNLTAVLP